ncbi:MAG: hypothetical protein AAB864_01735 [Patescibacteria group bacterium]
MGDYSFIFQTLFRGIGIAIAYWWTYLPLLLAFVLYELWMRYKAEEFVINITWSLLEIKPPPDVQKSPKIAENIFSALHSAYAGVAKFRERFFKGKLQFWYSFEIVGENGQIKFYIRTPQDLRNVVEAQIFAQYPEAEISVASDYVEELPRSLPNDEYDLFGAELIFTKEDAYPIKTYPFFEEESGKDEFKRTDPLAPLMESLSTLGPGEHIWLQLLARPTGGDWAKDAQAIVDKLAGKKAEAKANVIQKVVDGINALLPLGQAAPEKKEEKKEEPNVQKLTPGQRFLLEQVENKIAKLAFKCGYRLLYIAKKDVFNKTRPTGVTGMFKQMYSNNMNTFKPNLDTGTAPKGFLNWMFPSDKGFFADQQAYERKWKIYRKYKDREFADKVTILNTEELATLFHMPGLNVKAPLFPRVEAKKSQPPMGLPR